MKTYIKCPKCGLELKSKEVASMAEFRRFEQQVIAKHLKYSCNSASNGSTEENREHQLDVLDSLIEDYQKLRKNN